MNGWEASAGHHGMQAREVEPPHPELDLSCEIDATVQLSKKMGNKNVTATLERYFAVGHMEESTTHQPGSVPQGG